MPYGTTHKNNPIFVVLCATNSCHTAQIH
jgi:hypothetical protein